jgi:nucleoside-diphosphate-sugar epimerase
MKNILVTGGLGYIGSKFLEKYKNSYLLSVLDTSFYSNPNDVKDINFINKDIRNISKDDLKNIDIVVHMSELSNDPLGEFNPSLTSEINFEATKRLLNLCNEEEVSKFIYMSSASVYGFNENLITEESQTNPLTQYAIAKVNNENYILNNKFNFEIIILRNSTVFGYSNNVRLDLVVNDLTYSALKNKKITLISDGSPKRPFVHVEDLVLLIDKIIRDERNHHKEIYNVGDNSLNYSIREISEIISKLTSIDDIEIGEKDSDQRSYFLNFDKLNKTFPDFRIKNSMERGVEDLINNLTNYHLSGNEKRLQKLTCLIEEDNLDNNLFWR